MKFLVKKEILVKNEIFGKKEILIKNEIFGKKGNFGKN